GNFIYYYLTEQDLLKALDMMKKSINSISNKKNQMLMSGGVNEES
ncbi:MAG: hypothetical protein GY765_13285, partial [bacterium]|nr:hypothetical protein [bacterium]